MLKVVKLGRNDICDCGSGKKFKKCCNGVNKFEIGQKVSTDKIKTCIDAFKIMYDTYTIIDISDDLTESNYQKYQIKNYNANVIMLAEKNIINDNVFKTRVRDNSSDIIVMYHGSYRTFSFDDLEDLMPSICSMIDTSDSNKK